MGRHWFDNPYAPHSVRLASPLDVAAAAAVIAVVDRTTVRVDEARVHLLTRTRGATVRVQPDVPNVGAIGSPRVRVFRGSLSAQGSGSVLTGELYVAGVVRFFLLPGLAFFAIVFALAAVAFWPCALVALAFALGVASFFLPRLGVRSPALLEEATVHWLSSGLRAE